MKPEKIALIVIVTCIVAFIVMNVLKSCHITCDTTRENMTAGFSTISGVSMYNKAQNCHPSNSAGSNSPYCESVGSVLF